VLDLWAKRKGTLMTSEQATGDQSVEERVHRSVNRLQSLPALSSVVAKVLSLADSPTVSGQQVAEVVGKDQSMVTAILKIVNSPFYGLNRRVSSINHAVILLGYRTIRNVALSTSLVNAFSGAGHDPRFDRRRFWSHSIFTASAARLVAKRRRSLDAEEAFLAGLIHDMGRIVIDHHFPKEFGRAFDIAESRGIALHEAERLVLGMDHAELGNLIAQKWNFPPQIAEAIAVHHDPGAALATSELAVCVYLANILSRLAEDRAPAAIDLTGTVDSEEPERGCAAGHSGDGRLDLASCSSESLEQIDSRVLEHLELDDRRVGELLQDLEGEMEKAQAFLGALNLQ
jgi:putative nucleotidyltransferase with HDIG domain